MTQPTLREIWHVVVHLPKGDKDDEYYFASKQLVLSSIRLTYHKKPDTILIHQTDDIITVVEDGIGSAVIRAKRIFIPRDVRTEVDHF